MARSALLQASDVVELMLNSDGRVWADRLGKTMEPVCHMAPAAAESLIATVASTIRSTVTRENPILECELPRVAPFSGARFEAVIPPNVVLTCLRWPRTLNLQRVKSKPGGSPRPCAGSLGPRSAGSCRPPMSSS